MKKSIESLLLSIFSLPVGRFVAFAAGAALLGSSASANVNGSYKYQSAKGSFTIAGQRVNVGKNDLRAVVAKNRGRVIVRNNKITLFSKKAGEILDQGFSGPDFNIKIRASGPKSIPLRKRGASYSGKASKPILVRMTGTAAGQNLSSRIAYNFSAKVKGKKLRFNVGVNGGTQVAGFSQPITGKIVINARR